MSTAFLDPADAQMLDYPDLDIPMHPSTSSDGWFHNEAFMEDSSHSFAAHTPLQAFATLEGTHTSIEVDMKPSDDVSENEYEMADDESHAVEIDSQDVDIETQDVDFDPRDVEIDAQVLDVEAHTEDIETHDVDVENRYLDATYTVESHYAESHDFAGHEAESQVTGSGGPLDPEVDAHSSGVAEDVSTNHARNNDVANESAISTGVYSASTDDVESQQHIDPFSESNDSLHPGVSSTTSEEGLSISASTAETHFPPDTQVTSAGLVNSTSSTVPGAAAPISEDVLQSARDETISFVQEEDHKADDEQPNENNSSGPEHPNEDYRADTSSSGDPHEISEGVYIDPPPSVFLSVSDQAEFSLFNEPSSIDPHFKADQLQSERHTAHVLLQQFPTLYYEPLSSVFEALRQDDYITGIPEYSDRELAFEAYDLQLSISEDNVFAREVSLHDLNVLHDGSGISGPLRIRLQATVPRFFVRYHMLQEQVAQRLLGLGNETDTDRQPNALQARNLDKAEGTTAHQGQEYTLEHEDYGLEDHHHAQHQAETEKHERDQEACEQRKDNENTPVANQVDEAPAVRRDDIEKTTESRPLEDLGQPEHDNEEFLESRLDASHDKAHSYNTTAATVAKGYIGENTLTGDEDDAELEGTTNISGDDNSFDDEDQEALGGEEGAEEEEQDSFPDDSFLQSSGDKVLALNNSEHRLSVQGPSGAELSGSHSADDHSDQNVEQYLTSEPNARLSSSRSEDPNSVISDDFLGYQRSEFDQESNENTIKDTHEAEASILKSFQLEPSADDDQEEWGDDLDGEGDPDIPWDEEYEVEAASNESSTTMASKASKRSFDEFSLDPTGEDGPSSGYSPGKRTRVE